MSSQAKLHRPVAQTSLLCLLLLAVGGCQVDRTGFADPNGQGGDFDPVVDGGVGGGPDDADAESPEPTPNPVLDGGVMPPRPIDPCLGLTPGAAWDFRNLEKLPVADLYGNAPLEQAEGGPKEKPDLTLEGLIPSEKGFVATKADQSEAFAEHFNTAEAFSIVVDLERAETLSQPFGVIASATSAEREVFALAQSQNGNIIFRARPTDASGLLPIAHPVVVALNVPSEVRVVATFDRRTQEMQLFVNGSERATVDFSGYLVGEPELDITEVWGGDERITFGNGFFEKLPFTGLLRGAALYDVALTAEQLDCVPELQ